MPAEFAVAAKAITEKARQEGRVFGKRDHAVADIARRQHLKLLTQPSGTATVIRNSDYGGETFDPDFFFRLTDQSFETGEQSGETRAAADGYKFLTACGCCF